MRTLTRPRTQIGWKAWLGIGLVGPLVAGVAMIPTNASDTGVAARHDHGDHDHAAMTAGLEDDLAAVRRATARYHRLEAAEAVGYELGWVSGDGKLIVNGCIARRVGPRRDRRDRGGELRPRDAGPASGGRRGDTAEPHAPGRPGDHVRRRPRDVGARLLPDVRGTRRGRAAGGGRGDRGGTGVEARRLPRLARVRHVERRLRHLPAVVPGVGQRVRHRPALGRPGADPRRAGFPPRRPAPEHRPPRAGTGACGGPRRRPPAPADRGRLPRYYRVAQAAGGTRGITYTPVGLPVPDVVIDFWVLDVGGTVVVIDEWHDTNAPAKVVDRARDARRSITFAEDG